MFYLYQNRVKHQLLSRSWIKSWIKRAFTFPQLIQLSIENKYYKLRGAQIGAFSNIRGAKIQGSLNLIKVGSNSFIGRANIILHDTLIIGNNVVINDGVKVITASHDINSNDFRLTKKSVIIHDYAWICTGATILPGVKVGYGAVVGADAVVSKDVPALTVVVGNPAREIKKRNNIHFIYKPNLLRAAYDAWIR